MNKSNDELPPSYNELMGSAPQPTSLEFSTASSFNQPTTSQIGFTNINNIRISNPTLFPYKNFNVKIDTQTILDAINRKADDVLAKLLAQRTTSQREEIANLYFQMKNESLARDIKNNFNISTSRLLLVGLSVPYYEYLARSIHTCREFKWVYYILFTIPMSELGAFNNYFLNKYKCTSREFLQRRSSHKKTRFNFDPIKKILKYPRDERDRNNEKEVHDDVAKLKQLVGGSFFGGNESEQIVLKDIFLTKSFSHIKQVSEYYQTSTGTPIQIILKKVCTTHNLYCHIAEYALNPPNYFARTLQKAGFLTILNSEYLLAHIFIRRSEIDLYDIKMKFNAMNEKSLSTKIKGRWSGRFKPIVLQLLGEPDD